MNFISWGLNRIKLLCSVLLDYLIFIYSIKYNQFNFNYNVFFIISWIFLSYVFERYGFYKKISLKEISLNLLKKGVLIFFFLKIIYLLISLFTQSSYLLGNFNLYLINFSIYSFVAQTIFIFSTFELNSNNQTYIEIIGNKEFKSYIKEKMQYFNFINYKFKNSENYFKKPKHILNDVYKLQAAKWFEDKLHIIPSKLIDKQFFDQKEIKIFYFLNSLIKRFFDLLFSSLLIMLTSPILIIASFLIFIEDGGPIFYTQVRSGLRGKKFKIIKLRTMKCDAENGKAIWALKKDKRITKIGNILRKSRIDEIPQLWNVIRNDMSLIGPRPERPEIEIDLIKELPLFEIRHSKLPGLSGWAQVNYPYASSLKETENKLSFDLFYIKNASIFLDLIVFFKTIKIVLNRRGAIPRDFFE